MNRARRRRSRGRTAHPAHEGGVDADVAELSYDRRLGMAARRAADLFDLVSMFSTASLLRELAEAADFAVNAAGIRRRVERVNRIAVRRAVSRASARFGVELQPG